MEETRAVKLQFIYLASLTQFQLFLLLMKSFFLILS